MEQSIGAVNSRMASWQPIAFTWNGSVLLILANAYEKAVETLVCSSWKTRAQVQMDLC